MEKLPGAFPEISQHLSRVIGIAAASLADFDDPGILALKNFHELESSPIIDDQLARLIFGLFAMAEPDSQIFKIKRDAANIEIEINNPELPLTQKDRQILASWWLEARINHHYRDDPESSEILLSMALLGETVETFGSYRLEPAKLAGMMLRIGMAGPATAILGKNSDPDAVALQEKLRSFLGISGTWQPPRVDSGNDAEAIMLEFMTGSIKRRQFNFSIGSQVRIVLTDANLKNQPVHALANFLKSMETFLPGDARPTLGHIEQINAALKKLQTFEHFLLGSALCSLAFQRLEDLSLARYFRNVYEQFCMRLSQQKTSDLLLLGEVRTERPTETKKSNLTINNRRYRKIGSLTFSAAKSILKSRLVKFRTGSELTETQKEMLREELTTVLVSQLHDLKGGLLKVMQLGTTVSSLLPPDINRKLEPLLTNVEPLDYQAVAPQFIKSWGKSPHEIFDSFDETPFAAGSIGQVHRGSDQGRDIAVKVRYPDVIEAVRKDFKSMRQLKWIPQILVPRTDFKALVEEWESYIIAECSMKNEHDMGMLFSKIFEIDDNIVIPKFHSHLCSEQVLVMDYIEAPPVLISARRADQDERNEIGSLLTYSVLKAAAAGYFKYDIHAGNFLYGNGKLHLVDFGGVLPLARGQRFNILDTIERLKADDFEWFKTNMINLKYVMDAGKVDFDKLYDFYRNIYFRPFMSSVPFKFNREFVGEIFEYQFHKNPNIRHINIPKEDFAIFRFFWSFYDLLAQINCEVDCASIFLRAEGWGTPAVRTPSPV